jgi:hypothetical protein
VNRVIPASVICSKTRSASLNPDCGRTQRAGAFEIFIANGRRSKTAGSSTNSPVNGLRSSPKSAVLSNLTGLAVGVGLGSDVTVGGNVAVGATEGRAVGEAVTGAEPSKACAIGVGALVGMAGGGGNLLDLQPATNEAAIKNITANLCISFLR